MKMVRCSEQNSSRTIVLFGADDARTMHFFLNFLTGNWIRGGVLDRRAHISPLYTRQQSYDTDKMAVRYAAHHHLNSRQHVPVGFQSHLQSMTSMHTWSSEKDKQFYCLESLPGIKPDLKGILKSAESDRVDLDNQSHTDNESASQVCNLGHKTSIFTLKTLMQRANENRASYHQPRPNIRDLQNASHSVRHRLLRPAVGSKAVQSIGK